MVALVVVVIDEGLYLGFEVAGQEVIFQQDAVFQSLVPAFDLALGLRMHRSTAHMAHFIGLDILGQLAGDVAGAVIAEQPGLVRSEEHTSELQSLMRISYAVFRLKKKNTNTQQSK